MKKPANLEDLSARLSVAAATPLVAAPPSPAEPAPRTPKTGARQSVTVYLRLPPKLHAHYEAKAVARTKATGKGVTIQQIIIEQLEGGV